MKNKKFWIKAFKVTFLFILPLLFTVIVGFAKHEPYEFVDENNTRMVAPTTPLPYISSLMSDVSSALGVSWYSFCIENLSYSEKQNLPHDLAFRLDGTDDFTKINYGQVQCNRIYDQDIFYEVAWGGFEIPNRERADEIFECDGENCVLVMEIEEILNFNVYSKLNLLSLFIVYMLFIAVMYGLVSLVISIYKFIKKDSIL